jgi:hypothetical protein
MLLGLILAMIVASFFEVPIMWVLVIGAVCQGLAAFLITRNRQVIACVAGVVIIAANTWLIFPLIAGELPVAKDLINVFEWGIGVCSVLTIFFSTVVGMFGGHADIPRSGSESLE